MELQHPFLGIRYLDGADLTEAEVLFLHQVQDKGIAHLGVVADTLLQADIAFQQLHHRNLSGFIIQTIIDILLDFLFLLPKLLQVGIVDGVALAPEVRIAVLVNQVFSLAFSCAQDASFMVFAFFGYDKTPFRDGKGLDVT